MGNYLTDNIAELVLDAKSKPELAASILEFLRSEYYLVDVDHDIESTEQVMEYDELTDTIVDEFNESLKIVNYIENRGENN